MKANYIRVSTFEQNIQRQTKDGFDFTYIDKISGSTSLESRPQGFKLLKDIEAKKITELHIHSIDRLGRNTIDILTTIKKITALGCNVVSEKEGLKMLIDGKINPIASLMVGILSTISEFELTRIKERQIEGMEKAKIKGSFLKNRRPIGTVESKEQFLNKAKVQKIIKNLELGYSLRKSALLSKASLSLAQKVSACM